MTWNDNERRLLAAGKTLGPELDASRDRLLFVISSSGAVALAAASVKAAITLEAKLALITVGQAGLTGLAKATIVGGVAGVALGTAGEVMTRLSTQAIAASDTNRITEIAPARAPRSADGADSARLSGAATAHAAATAPATHTIGSAEGGAATEGGALAGAAIAGAAPTHANRLAPPLHSADQAVRDASDKVPPAPAIPSSPEQSSADGGLAALDAAKSALDHGDHAAANKALADYDSMRGGGALDPEAAVLRLQALAAAGQGAAAAALARQWLAQHPNTPYADTLRRIAIQSNRDNP